ncbi:MAG: hypothetical protein A2498_07935 [Lentisphaerae bacterium RIFOXYC12_FULL_60_16]|nr:MAG: hypothetical protein A2498_07935 [Lentisphaerae bacterium RIFOXYC12_FULL_60_16]OGV77015.1 MAG: hypothetical protein A2340_15640 [Lentisphaerae bacterium RIFOXYB12_FULL_60_10]
MNRYGLVASVILGSIFLGTPPVPADDWFVGGRAKSDNRDFSLRAAFGQLREIQIGVKETTRRLYDVTDSSWKQETAEDYDLNDFGMSGGYNLTGASLEKIGRYFTFQLDAAFMSPSANPTAQRDYYIEVGDSIEYDGQSYNQMKIPDGSEFQVEMTGGSVELHGLITPFTVKPAPAFSITPWVDLGLFSFIGDYDIDAGEPQGVVQYQNPPEDFVVGGRSSGFMGLALPEWGGGGEIRFGAPGEWNLVLQASATICQFTGSTKMLTVNEHREKNVDIDHRNLRLRVLFEVPLNDSIALTAGVHYQKIESFASITSSADSPEEVIATRERFDKEVDFRMDSLMGLVGITF